MADPKPPLPGAVKLSFNFTGPDSVTASCILHMDYGSDLTSAELAELAGWAFGAWAGTEGGGPYPIAAMVASWHLVLVQATSLGGDELAGDSTQTPAAGTAGGNALSPQVCLLSSWHTALAYRGGHPRTYAPGPPEEAVDDAGGRQWNTSLTNGQNANLAAFMASMNGYAIGGSGPTGTLGCVSYYRAKALRTTPLFVPFVGVTTRSRLCTQRRRLGKMGG